VAARIRYFAEAQREALVDVDVEVTGGRAGHRWVPVASVGAYAPGGRYPLPSSVLMTVVPAWVAGVKTVWVASPRPNDVTLAAAAVAGADGLLAIGGTQAIAALAFGVLSPACDLIVGPGNKYVTAAKKALFGEVGIDGLAGPSEILVVADDRADPALVAADLLAQAEHDIDALPLLVTTSLRLANDVDHQIELQLADLPTSSVARQALTNGFSLVVGSLDEAVSAAERMAPEHLALHVEQPGDLLGMLTSYGSVFLGGRSAEAFADYGVGPNHVLPTAGGARFQSGLSVMSFLKAPTWSRLDDPSELIEDTVLLARLEGLEAHARAALIRVDDV
jgi:phosphoribosyl-ATP pyrophosphohydrolase/phosphoribosyl-AMP cyclohydrolase/histidinol dehydrogenase